MNKCTRCDGRGFLYDMMLNEKPCYVCNVNKEVEKVISQYKKGDEKIGDKNKLDHIKEQFEYVKGTETFLIITDVIRSLIQQTEEKEGWEKLAKDNALEMLEYHQTLREIHEIVEYKEYDMCEILDQIEKRVEEVLKD